MLRTNADRLAMLSVLGQVGSPMFGPTPYRVGTDGRAQVLPATGGITYNAKVGDLCSSWDADHIEPGVSARNPVDVENNAFNVLSQVGNEARVVSGDAKGDRGVVTGKHGGVEHVMIDFPDATLDKLAIGDKVQVKGYGTPLRLLDYPDVTVMNLDPGLLAKMPVGEDRTRGVLTVPVTHVVPAAVMGSGLGKPHSYQGDYDIQLFDEATVRSHGLDTLRLGDIVAIDGADSTYGRVYKPGAVTVGIVVHATSIVAGHGPGVTTLLTSATGKIAPKLHARANIADYLKIGRRRRAPRRSTARKR